MLCRHCQKTKSNRPRGLCWSCYYRPGVREQYPSTSKFARRGVKDFNGRFKLGEPTNALPGTEEKIRVMMERAALGQSLFHPLDAKIGNMATRPSLPPVDADPEPIPEGMLEELLGDEADEMEFEEATQESELECVAVA